MRYFSIAVIYIIFSFSVCAADDKPRELQWDELMPVGGFKELEIEIDKALKGIGTILEGSDGDEAVQFGTFKVVESLNGKKVRIPGYILPFDYNSTGEISEFLLVPYYGACLHSPPPPPNQMIYVTTEKPILVTDNFMPVWIEGTLVTKKNLNTLGDAAYSLLLDRYEDYTTDD